MSKSIAVVMPACNEAGVIASVISRIPAEINGMTVFTIVVDDGSKDRTADAARRSGAFVVRHLTNLGVGAATITGLRAAQKLDAHVVVTMDSDGQHDPAEISSLVRCLLEGPFDVVIGSRVLAPEGMPLSRIGANLLLNAITFIVYGKVVSDSQSGFKAITSEALSRMKLNSPGYEICSEFIGEVHRNHLSYKSLPVKALYTQYSQRKGQPFLNGINLILGMLTRLLRRT
jgi:glycosyltransferase involved in cell wall biosynthesis